MNVLLVLEMPFIPSAGGVQRSTAKMSEALAKRGYHVQILCARYHEDALNSWKGVAVEYISLKDTNSLKGFIALKKFKIIINQSGFVLPLAVNLYRMKSDDTILINVLRFNPMAFIENYDLHTALKLKKHFGGFGNLGKLFKFLIIWRHRIVQRQTYKRLMLISDRLVTLSDSYKSDILTFANNSTRYSYKLVAIPNLFEVRTSFLKRESKRQKILFVGRLNIEDKRCDLLIEIIKRMHHSLTDWEFYIVGDGPYKNTLENIKAEFLLDRLFLEGRKDPEPYYLDASIFLMTSATEGFPNVLVEAQSYGCVPVAFDSFKAVKDIIEHNYNGLLVSDFSVDSYVRQVLDLIYDVERMTEISQNCLESVKRFDVDVVMEKWIELFAIKN